MSPDRAWRWYAAASIQWLLEPPGASYLSGTVREEAALSARVDAIDSIVTGVGVEWVVSSKYYVKHSPFLQQLCSLRSNIVVQYRVAEHTYCRWGSNFVPTLLDKIRQEIRQGREWYGKSAM